MVSLVNGKPQQNINLTNRSFAFGDGIFETCRVIDGNILYFDYHLKRLKKGIEVLKINLDYKALMLEINQILVNAQNNVLKIIISRGQSVRGYVFSKDMPAIRVLMLSQYFSASNNIRLDFCQSGYCHNSKLAGIKHQNRLEQIMARGFSNDCFMLDKFKNVISTTTANIFIVKDGIITTPNLDNCGILGTRRSVILDYFQVQIKNISQNKLLSANEIFITNSLGIISITKVQDINFEINIASKIRKKLKC